MRIRLYNRVVNPFVRAILRSRLHGLLSGSLVLLSYTGPRSGRRITLPVMYAEDASGLVVFVGRPELKRWWRSLRGAAPVTVRLRGQERTALAEVAAADTEAIEAGLRVYLARFPRAAKAFPGAEGAVMVRVRLTP
ncbi:MAG TPA: nitroreductase/quinone reductase family protein [Methylomirabilota bacterium]|nr:nitroreductase/quinone reductase family protein [Methylomirabilota bacterium]